MYNLRISVSKNNVEKLIFSAIISVIILVALFILILNSTQDNQVDKKNNNQNIGNTEDSVPESAYPVYLNIEDRKNIEFGDLVLSINENSRYEFNTLFRDGLGTNFFCNSLRGCLILEVSDSTNNIYISFPETISITGTTDTTNSKKETENIQIADKSIELVHVKFEEVSIPEEGNKEPAPTGNTVNYKSYFCIKETCFTYFYTNIFDKEKNKQEQSTLKSFLEQINFQIKDK